MTTSFTTGSFWWWICLGRELINAMKKWLKSISRRFSTSSASSYTSTHRKLKNAKQSINTLAVSSTFLWCLYFMSTCFFFLGSVKEIDTICHTWHLNFFSKQKAPRYAFNGSTSVVINIYEETLNVKFFGKYQGHVNKLTGL